MYGAGLRVSEAVRLRVKDLDFRHSVIMVRDGKGAKDRTTLLPQPLRERLRRRVATIEHAVAARSEHPRVPVSLPFALARKYPMPESRCIGNGFSPRPDYVLTTMVWSLCTIYISARFKKPSGRPSNRPASVHQSAAIPFGTVSPLSYYNAELTSGPFRSSWDTATSEQRRFIPMCLGGRLRGSKVHLAEPQIARPNADVPPVAPDRLVRVGHSHRASTLFHMFKFPPLAPCLRERPFLSRYRQAHFFKLIYNNGCKLIQKVPNLIPKGQSSRQFHARNGPGYGARKYDLAFPGSFRMLCMWESHGCLCKPIKFKGFAKVYREAPSLEINGYI